MARLSTYGVDATPELGDKTVGTDASAGANFKTKNYSLGDVAGLFNKTNSLGVADQVLYFFQTDISEGRDEGTISFQGGGGVGTSFGSVTEVLLSKRLIGNKIIDDYVPLFKDRNIILAELGNINNFGTYSVSSIVEHPTETEFFVVTLSVVEFNGVMALDATYIISDFSRPGGDDKNFIFTQAVPSSTWTINHGLNKNPSVSVVNNNNILIYGDTTYIDKNNLIISFSAGFSGKAFLN